jgi:dTDP-4-amino-4,6-dideoxygalactose transaminase
MDPLCATARKHGLVTIEDACEAIGATYNERPAGSYGDCAVFAFYPNKQMTTGEGGMILTRRKDWDDLFRSLRNQGRDVFDAWLNHSRLGYNYRLDEMSAALGGVQLSRLDELIAKRERVAGWYTTRLESFRDLIEPPQIVSTTTKMSWFVYVVRLSMGIDRHELMCELDEVGIPSRPYFTPIHLQPFYRERFAFKPGDFPIAEDLGRRCLALPFSGVMTEQQVDYVCQNLVEQAKAKYALS